MFLLILLFEINKISAILKCNDYCDSSESTQSNCFCSNCDQYSDCCQGSQIPISQQNNPYECNSLISVHDSISIYTKGKCPDTYQKQTIRLKCENDTNDLIDINPVYAFQTGLFYKLFNNGQLFVLNIF